MGGGKSENENPCLIGAGSPNMRTAGVGKMKEGTQNQRRALISINQNIMLQPCLINKRGFSGKDITCDKKSEMPKMLAEDYKIIGVEECDDDNKEVDVPLFVKHAEDFLDEIDRMDVDEMEEDVEDPILDIDSNDLEDPLAVVEYVDDIYAYYRKTEISSFVFPNYMDNQSDINEKMRAILIDWLIEVHYKFELMEETLFLTINIIDRFLKAAQSDKKLERLSFFVIELCLVEYEMLKFPPSLLAAAAIYTAQCSLYQFKQWSKTSEWHTNYSEDQLWECSRLIVSLHQKAGAGKLTGVYKKYSSSKFGYAAKAEPARFLLTENFDK
ncbi:hypothetical protein Q3G72_033036 [Acer saccharum]|nr:hypothetical protein Q3G72_033036 [Acer saccharum]